jgi:hypothetical protein
MRNVYYMVMHLKTGAITSADSCLLQAATRVSSMLNTEYGCGPCESRLQHQHQGCMHVFAAKKVTCSRCRGSSTLYSTARVACHVRTT